MRTHAHTHATHGRARLVAVLSRAFLGGQATVGALGEQLAQLQERLEQTESTVLAALVPAPEPEPEA